MRVLITGSSGHLGEGLVRTLRELEHEVVGLDIIEGPFTTCVGSITDRSCVRRCMVGVQTVFHAATLHKPHIATHTPQEFVDNMHVVTGKWLQASTASMLTNGLEMSSAGSRDTISGRLLTV